MKVTITFHNSGHHTIWGKLAQKLGREPTNQEAAEEVRRILRGETEVSGPADQMREGGAA